MTVEDILKMEQRQRAAIRNEMDQIEEDLNEQRERRMSTINKKHLKELELLRRKQ